MELETTKNMPITFPLCLGYFTRVFFLSFRWRDEFPLQ